MLRDFGTLLTTEVEYVDLGEHGGRHLRGMVERRVFRIGASRGRGFSLTAGRNRATAIEVSEPGRPPYAVHIDTPPDPRLRAAQCTAAFALAAWLVMRVLARVRHTRSQGG